MTNSFSLLILPLFMLSSCSNRQEGSQKTEDAQGACKWQSLPKTTGYDAELQKIAEGGKDTLIILESVKIGNSAYKTTMDIKQNELKVWIDVAGEENRKIVLHQEDFVESFLTITTTFDIKNCKATRRTETTDPTNGYTDSKTEELKL